MTGNFVHSEKPIRIDRGEGVHLYDEEGTAYIDCGASYACTPLGHGHPAVVEAARSQLERLLFVQASYPVAARDRAYATVADAAPAGLDNVWLCNSGTEANEAALKFARSATGDSGIVATMQGFHGRTMGALATTWTKAYRTPYEPLIGDVSFVPYGDPDGLAEAVDDETAAVIIEPIQGEGGINVPPADYLSAAREVTEDAGAALVLDEIQTGLGRTGTLWACEQAGVVPDVLTTAKGLANGLPVGATVCADWIAEGAASHNSTFSGGPVISAAVDATLSTIVDEELPDRADRVGAELADALREVLAGDVRAVRGEGLMIGVEVPNHANRIARQLALDEQVLVLTSGRTVVRLLPPLVLSADHVDTLVAAMASVIGGERS